jgi:hypothetical protein
MADFVEGDETLLQVNCIGFDRTAIDVSGATVTLRYRIAGGSLQSKTMTINAPNSAGQVQYQFLSGDLTPGKLSGEVGLQDNTGKAFTSLRGFHFSVRPKI